MAETHIRIGLNTPWSYEVHELCSGFSAIVYDAEGKRVRTDHLYEGDAADIVKAVNSHDKLVSALDDLMMALDDIEMAHGLPAHVKMDNAREKARTLLSKLKGLGVQANASDSEKE